MPLSVKRNPNLHWFFARFLVPLGSLPATVKLNDPELAHHLKNVMRLKPGEKLVLVDELEKQPYLSQIEALQNQHVTVTVIQALPVNVSDVSTSVVAAVCLIKGPRWDWMLQKLTELGISEIIPVISERTIIDVKKPETKLERWSQILKNAAEQSERVFIPKIRPPLSLTAFVSQAQQEKRLLKLVASEHATVPLSQALQGRADYGKMLFVVGPEGGWSDAELGLLQDGGFQSVSLGDKILRSETAALYLATVGHYVTFKPPHESP